MESSPTISASPTMAPNSLHMENHSDFAPAIVLSVVFGLLLIGVLLGPE